MERPRSTTATTLKSLHSCSPSSVPTPLSIPTPQGVRRSHLTPTSIVDGEMSLSKIDRLSPQQYPRTPTALETGTPRLAAAVSEAKRGGAAAPSPSYGSDVPDGLDKFDKLLSMNALRFGNTPSQTPLSGREEAGSPNAVSRVVKNVIGDEGKRRDFLLTLTKIMHDAKAGGALATSTRTGSRNNTPRTTPPAQQQQDAAALASLGTLARFTRDISPLQGAAYGTSSTSVDWHADPIAFTQEPKKGICRPRPTKDSNRISTRQFEEALAQRQVPTSQKIIKSEMSAFSETTETSSLTSYSTNKSAKHTRSGSKGAANLPHY